MSVMERSLPLEWPQRRDFVTTKCEALLSFSLPLELKAKLTSVPTFQRKTKQVASHEAGPLFWAFEAAGSVNAASRNYSGSDSEVGDHFLSISTSTHAKFILDFTKRQLTVTKRCLFVGCVCTVLTFFSCASRFQTCVKGEEGTAHVNGSERGRDLEQPLATIPRRVWRV